MGLYEARGETGVFRFSASEVTAREPAGEGPGSIPSPLPGWEFACTGSSQDCVCCGGLHPGLFSRHLSGMPLPSEQLEADRSTRAQGLDSGARRARSVSREEQAQIPRFRPARRTSLGMTSSRSGSPQGLDPPNRRDDLPEEVTRSSVWRAPRRSSIARGAPRARRIR
jgi:hypothetical protein